MMMELGPLAGRQLGCWKHSALVISEREFNLFTLGHKRWKGGKGACQL